MKTFSLFLLFGFGLLFFDAANAQNQQCPCCTEKHKAFDFWIGEWVVSNPKDAIVGYSSIVKIQGGCALQENWRSDKTAFTGTSYNYYNQQEQRWEQLWIDNSGRQLKLYGNRKGNQMVLSSEPYNRPDGKEYINRITWTANTDGTVRQLWEVLHEEEVVQVAFDGYYEPVYESGE